MAFVVSIRRWGQGGNALVIRGCRYLDVFKQRMRCYKDGSKISPDKCTCKQCVECGQNVKGVLLKKKITRVCCEGEPDEESICSCG